MQVEKFDESEKRIKLCAACGEPVQDATQEYCDQCLEDEAGDLAEDLLPQSMRQTKMNRLKSRYDTL